MAQIRQTEPYMSTYLHGKGARLGLPIGGNFELTPRCNFNCPMCYVHRQNAEGELTGGQWIELARQARDGGMIFALLTGGEPFLRKDFFQIYSQMKAMGILVSINSNGALLNGSIREQLIADPPMRLNISLYGGCRETYRKMCGRDAFEQVVENIRALKEAGVDVRLNVSLTPDNYRDLDRIFAISREMNIPAKATSYMYPPVRLSDAPAYRLSAEDAAKCMVQWDRLRLEPEEFALRAAAYGTCSAELEGECGADVNEGVSCRAGRSSFWLTWDGRMLPCGMMPGPESRPLEVGFGEAWAQLRQATADIRLPGACSGCPKRKICTVCAAVCVAETGAFDGKPEYVCRMTEEILGLYQKETLQRSADDEG